MEKKSWRMAVKQKIIETLWINKWSKWSRDLHWKRNRKNVNINKNLKEMFQR